MGHPKPPKRHSPVRMFLWSAVGFVIGNLLWSATRGRLDMGLPLAILAGVVFSAGFAAIVYAIDSHRIRRYRPPWCCPGCGYDRRGLADYAKCPECGGIARP